MNTTVNHDTHVAHIEAVVARQRTFFETGATRPVAVRVAALRRLKKEMQKREKILLDALQADLNKSHFEGYMCELGLNLDELGYLADHVRAWSQPRRKPTPLPQFKSSSYELPEPYGVVLIMAPWNYPYLLSLDPLFGAVAAGKRPCFCRHKIFGRGKILGLMPPNKVQVSFAGFGIKVILADYLQLED